MYMNCSELDIKHLPPVSDSPSIMHENSIQKQTDQIFAKFWKAVLIFFIVILLISCKLPVVRLHLRVKRYWIQYKFSLYKLSAKYFPCVSHLERVLFKTQ